MSNVALEIDTRDLIDESLKNLGWVFRGVKRNVFREQAKTEDEQRKLGGKRPDYVLYAPDDRGDERPIIVIEAKRPGSRVDVALEQGIHYAKALDAPIVFATDGLFCKSYHTKFDRTPLLNGEELDEFQRQTLAIEYFATWKVNTVSDKVQMCRKELIRIFDEANNMLRGDGLRAGIERFGEFANILFLKLISENAQTATKSARSFDIDFACRWEAIKKVPLDARIDYINNTVYPRLNKRYNTEIFTPLTIRSDTILSEIMDKLNDLTLSDVDSDVKGDAFEYFLKESAATKNDLGEYFTPRHIVKTMVKLVNPQIGESVYDPFCGTGGFLIESFRHIHSAMARNAANEKRLREKTIYGNEITNTARIAKMNMILAGDGHSNINMRDSLAEPIDGTEEYEETQPDGTKVTRRRGYDVVITNMPYSQKTKYGKLYDLDINNGDSICVQHCMKAVDSTAENGRMALVVPEGFLFRKDLTKTRELLLSRCELRSVISLPQGVFLPYTGVKTNILYATKVNQKLKASEKRKDFWYFDVKSDGYSLDNHRRKLNSGSDLDKYQEFRKLDDDQRQEMLDVGFEVVPTKKVKENSYILIGSRYREQKQYTSQYCGESLGELCTIANGYTFPLALQGAEGDVPFYKVSDMNLIGNEIHMDTSNNYVTSELVEEHNWKLAPAGTVIFPKIGAAIATNKKRLLTVPSLFDNNVMGLVCGERIVPKYLYYLMTHIDISSWASLSNPPSISRDIVNGQMLPIPDVDVQLAIVKELDDYQRIVDGAHLVVGSYAPKIKRALDWRTVKVGDLFDIVKDTVNPQECVGNVNYIGLENIKSNTGELIGDIVADVTSIKSLKRSFSKGDILYGKLRPNLNKVYLAEVDGVCSTDIIVLRPRSSEVVAEFYAVLLRGEEFSDFVMGGVSGGQLPRVDLEYFRSLPIWEVPQSSQIGICEQLRLEQSLVAPSKQLIEVFAKKINDRINEIWGERVE